MSSPTYQLVCYVNQVTGLYLSKNYAVIPIFLQRAHGQLSTIHSERVSDPYRKLVLQYLSHVAHFIAEFNCMDEDEEHVTRLIPQALLDMIPEALPEDLIVAGEF